MEEIRREQIRALERLKDLERIRTEKFIKGAKRENMYPNSNDITPHSQYSSKSNPDKYFDPNRVISLVLKNNH